MIEASTGLAMRCNWSINDGGTETADPALTMEFIALSLGS